MKGKKRFIVLSFLAGVLILALLVGFSDAGKLREIAHRLEYGWALLGLGSAVAGLALFSLSFLLVVRAGTGKLSGGHIFRTAFVAFAFDRMFSSWGISGYAVRGYLFASAGLAYGETLIYTVIYSCIHFLVLLVIFAATVFLFLPALPSGIGHTAVVAQLVVFTLALAYAVHFLFSPVTRGRWVSAGAYCLNRLALRWRKRQVVSPETVESFQNILESAVQSLRSGAPRLILPLLIEIPAWCAEFFALYSMFRACGQPVGPGVLISGYVIGAFWVSFLLLPGHLGVLEGSVSGVYALFGIPFATAVAATVSFRIVSYFIPFLLAFAFVPSLMRQAWSVGLAPRSAPASAPPTSSPPRSGQT